MVVTVAVREKAERKALPPGESGAGTNLYQSERFSCESLVETQRVSCQQLWALAELRVEVSSSQEAGQAGGSYKMGKETPWDIWKSTCI